MYLCIWPTFSILDRLYYIFTCWLANVYMYTLYLTYILLLIIVAFSKNDTVRDLCLWLCFLLILACKCLYVYYVFYLLLLIVFHFLRMINFVGWKIFRFCQFPILDSGGPWEPTRVGRGAHTVGRKAYTNVKIQRKKEKKKKHREGKKIKEKIWNTLFHFEVHTTKFVSKGTHYWSKNAPDIHFTEYLFLNLTMKI